MKTVIRALIVVACLLPSIGRADPPAFDAAQTQDIERIIQREIEKALAKTAHTDAQVVSPTPSTKITEADAPTLSEGQRLALEQMIDKAILRERALREGPSLAIETATMSPPTPTVCFDGDVAPPLPVTDLRADTLRALAAARRDGFDMKAADCGLRTRSGSASAALKLTDTGLNSAPATPKASNFQVVANGSGARVSLKMDQSTAVGDPQGKALYWSRSAVFSAPVDKDDDVGTGLVDLDGLTNGFEFTYNATRIKTAPLGRLTTAGDSLLFEMPKACSTLGISMTECELSTLLRVAHARAGEAGKAGADAQAIADRYSVPGRAWLQGFRLKVGHNDYTYYDPARLTKHTDDEVSWGAGVFAGILTGNAYYAAGIDYQRAYKGARSGVACPLPSDGEEVVLCVNGALGAPSVGERHLLSAEGRWRLGERAIGVRAIHDFKNGVSGIDMPIYLFPDEKGFLTGGLRLGWTNEEQFYAAIFVGVPFKLMD
jgi:hypothetical protein